MSARSDLELDWFMVTDSTLGLVFPIPVGARGVSAGGGWFSYAVNIEVEAMELVKAFEVRILTFNVWGEFTGTLSFTQLEDLQPGQRKEFPSRWGLMGESPLRAHVTSIAYVARVMKDDGTVIFADPDPVLRMVQRIAESVTLQDLEPTPEPGRVFTPSL